MTKKYHFTLRQNSEKVVSTFATDSEDTAVEFYLWARNLYGICINLDAHILLLDRGL